jgi:hypothetical protein
MKTTKRHNLKKFKYCNQFKAISNTRLDDYGCGLSCVAMSLYSLGKISKQRLENIDWLVYLTATLHKDGEIEMVQEKFEIDQKKVWITTNRKTEGFKPKTNQRTVHNNEDLFFPCFSTYQGYSHKSSEYLFSIWDVKAELVLNMSWEKLTDHIRKGNWAMISVGKTNPGGCSVKLSHVVWATNIENLNTIIAVDPGTEDQKYKEIEITQEFYYNSCNHHGTLIYTEA